MKKEPIGLLLVTHNRAGLLRELLKALSGFNWDYSEFIIVDNASTDETQEILDEFKSLNSLSILRLSNNVGHGAGLASGLELLRGKNPDLDYVVFLEDDSIPKPEFLNFLLSQISGSEYAMISSGGANVRLGKRQTIKNPKGEIEQADFVLFDGAIAKFKSLMNVGLPQRDWFMMFDDFEYCYRLRKNGLRLGVTDNPYVTILHEGWGGGTSHSHIWRSYYQSRNFIHFVKLYPTVFNVFDCLILQTKRIIGGLFIGRDIMVTKMRLMGIRAAFLGKKGKSLDLITLQEV